MIYSLRLELLAGMGDMPVGNMAPWLLLFGVGLTLTILMTWGRRDRVRGVKE